MRLLYSRSFLVKTHPLIHQGELRRFSADAICWMVSGYSCVPAKYGNHRANTLRYGGTGDMPMPSTKFAVPDQMRTFDRYSVRLVHDDSEK